MSNVAWSNKNNKNQIISNEQNFKKDIIYIHGTKQGYEANKNDYISIIMQKGQSKRTKKAFNNIVNRYINMKTEKQITNLLTNEEIIKMQEDWVKAIDEGLKNNSNYQNIDLQKTLKASQMEIWKKLEATQEQTKKTLEDNSTKGRIEKIEEIMIDLEGKINSLSIDEQISLQMLLDPKKLEEGSITNLEVGEQVLSKIRNTLNRLKEESASQYNIFVNINREIGAIAELVDIAALNSINMEVENFYNKSKVVQTGSRKTTKNLTAKPDALFTYEIITNDSKEPLLLQFGLSLKTTGSIIDIKDDNSINVVNARKKQKIQIASISQQQKVWSMLENIYQTKSSKKNQNAVLNTLVWANSNTNVIKMIKKNLVDYYFEKFIAGSGEKFKDATGLDVADCLIVNKKPYSIAAILIELVEDEKNFYDNSAYVNLIVPKNNKWIGDEGIENQDNAIKRSNLLVKDIKNNLKLKVSLKGNVLYNIAKKNQPASNS